MLSKIYFAILVLAGLATGFSAFYANQWLGSIGNPQTAATGFEYHSSIGGSLVSISFLVLALVSIVILWQKQQIWALWTSFGFMAFSMLLLLFNINSFKEFVAANSIPMANDTILNPFVVAVLIVFLAVTLAVIQVLVLRIRIKIKKEPEPAVPVEKE